MVRIEAILGSKHLVRVDLRGPLSHGYDVELERQVKEAIKLGARVDFVEMESKGAVERFKKQNQPCLAHLCRHRPITPALRLGDFYLPIERELPLDFPKYFSLIADKEHLYICSADSKQELAHLRQRALQWDELSHLVIGHQLVRCLEGTACYLPLGARAKGVLKQELIKQSQAIGFEPIGVRSRGVVWKFLRDLGVGNYAQLEVREHPTAVGHDLFSLRCEGALVLRALGSKRDLEAAATSSLQLIHNILKMGEVKEIAPQRRGGNTLVVLSARLEEVEIAEWETTSENFELVFYIDRWIGVLIEVGKQRAVSWLMREGCLEN